MGEFDFWQKWGLELNDKQFADAFTALGVLAASFQNIQDANSSEPSTPEPPDEFSSELSEIDSLRLDLIAALYNPFEVPWRFPIHSQQIWIGKHRVLLSSLNPIKIAEIWKSIINEPDILETRFNIYWYPADEPIRPWFRLFFEAAPQNSSAYIRLDTGKAQLVLRWPLRLGFIPGTANEQSVLRMRLKWPSSDLTSAVQIDRENANCDVFLFTGSSSQLLKTLLEMPVPLKANLLIVRGSFEDDIASMVSRLSAIATECRASGLIILNATVNDDALEPALNRFIENLSHNQPFDIALSEAFTKSCQTDPVIFLSRDLATFQLDYVLKEIKSRMINLPKAARPQIESDTLLRMGIPVDIKKDDLTIPENVIKKLDEYKDSIQYDAESSGALSMAKLSKWIDHAESQAISEKQQQRYLQEQTFIKKKREILEERRAFIKSVPTLIRIRIGPLDEKWTAIDTSFPAEKLPTDREYWRLTVVLSEPNHLKEPLRKTIRLPKTGPSSECEFRIQPRDYPAFEGRISVLHRGRILQTGLLKGTVVSEEHDITSDYKIAFVDILPVRANIGDLGGRRQYDLAFVFNHTEDHRPRLTAIAKDHAWVTDLKAFDEITKRINAKLSKVAKLVKEYSGGLNSKNNRALLVELARIGRLLYGNIVTEQLQAPTNQSGIASREYIQVVSTRSDAMIPLEFIYDCETPQKNATLCPSWQEALSEGKCKTDCRTDKRKHVCPLGFWGVSKVIERHALTPGLAKEGKDFFLQSDPTRNSDTLNLSGTAVIAASERVKAADKKPMVIACKNFLGAEPQEAKNWDQWVELISQYNPSVLLALPHTDGEGENASMEIGGISLESVDITEAYVRKPGGDTYPLVALLGCDIAGTALEYGDYVSGFRWNGASIVIGTIATVFGKHAAKVAAMLIRGIRPRNKQPERLGEVIRSIKRQALLDGMLMPLCIVAFGDADWKLDGRRHDA